MDATNQIVANGSGIYRNGNEVARFWHRNDATARALVIQMTSDVAEFLRMREVIESVVGFISWAAR